MILLRLCATPRDRNALTILLVVGVVSTSVVHLVICHIQASWTLIVPAANETLTMLAMLTWANPKTALNQAFLLLVAWWAHVQCYIDIQNETNVIYDNYETLLALVAIGQLLACHDTIFSIGRRVSQWFSILVRGGRGVLAPGGGNFLVYHKDKPPEQKPR